MELGVLPRLNDVCGNPLGLGLGVGVGEGVLVPAVVLPPLLVVVAGAFAPVVPVAAPAPTPPHPASIPMHAKNNSRAYNLRTSLVPYLLMVARMAGRGASSCH